MNHIVERSNDIVNGNNKVSRARGRLSPVDAEPVDEQRRKDVTRSSAVAVIADRTAYDDNIPANYRASFGYKFTNGWYACTIRFNR